MSVAKKNMQYVKPALTPEIPRKGIKICLRRSVSLQNHTNQTTTPLLATKENKFIFPKNYQENNQQRTDIEDDNRAGIVEKNEANSLTQEKRKTASNVHERSMSRPKIHTMKSPEVGNQAAKGIFFHRGVSLDLNTSNRNKNCECDCHQILRDRDMNTQVKQCLSCQCTYSHDVDKKLTHKTRLIKSSSGADEIDEIVNRRKLNGVPAINFEIITDAEETRKSFRPLKLCQSQPCSPNTSPLLNKRRPASAKQLFSFCNDEMEMNLDRRSTVANVLPHRKTFGQWLQEKNDDQRRQSLNTLESETITRLGKDCKKLERLVHGKTFDEWKQEKDENVRKQLVEKRKSEERTQKLEQQREHEKLTERKYNEWLMKKYEQEMTRELSMMEELKNSKEQLSAPKIQQNVKKSFSHGHLPKLS